MSIIALTIVTRTLLIPLTYKQLKGMRALQALQPQIKELQAKYKNDRQRMQQEMMAFYKEHKVNPFASCVPLVAQLPVFITLFYTLRHELADDIGCLPAAIGGCGNLASFGPIPNLTEAATGGVLIGLMILYVGTQLAAGMVMSVTAERSQRIMMFALPLIFVPFVITFPSGLVVYWIATNVWTIGQSFVIQRVVPAPTVPTPAQAAALKPPPPPPRKKKKRR
jgi:YidC/Oxa1 family membrane protein insertase